MKTNPYDLNAMAERRRRAEAKMGKCPTCGHNPATDHLKMQDELTQALGREKRLREAAAAYLRVKKSWDNRLPELVELKTALAASEGTKK